MLEPGGQREGEVGGGNTFRGKLEEFALEGREGEKGETVCKGFKTGLLPGDAEASGPETRRSNFRYFPARTRNP